MESLGEGLTFLNSLASSSSYIINALSIFGWNVKDINMESIFRSFVYCEIFFFS